MKVGDRVEFIPDPKWPYVPTPKGTVVKVTPVELLEEVGGGATSNVKVELDYPVCYDDQHDPVRIMECDASHWKKVS